MLLSVVILFVFVRADDNAKRLFNDLMMPYNGLRRPVLNTHDVINIKLRLRLSQILEVHEKNQIMTTSVWLLQEWYDSQLVWDKSLYAGVDVLYIPSEMIWVPDIVLYNNADSNYNITINTKATVKSNGIVTWEPPAIFKSMCPIDVEWFPFDEQRCILKFGSWTFSEELLDLEHFQGNVEYISEGGENVSVVWSGIDISQYYPSVEWDLLEVPAKRHGKTYPSCCPESNAYIDISYYISIRRKPLFYTVNLISPCVGISMLTVTVFYLPSDSGEKITLCISILVSLTVFFLLLTEIIPSTSIVLPLIGKYLLFTMIMVTLSIMVTVLSLNFHFRSPTTHRMPAWIKCLLLNILPHWLLMRRPTPPVVNRFLVKKRRSRNRKIPQETTNQNRQIRPPFYTNPLAISPGDTRRIHPIYKNKQVLKAFNNINFIAELMRKKDMNSQVDEDWKFVAMVLDRLFLFIFSIACILGIGFILLQAPALYDNREALDLTTMK